LEDGKEEMMTHIIIKYSFIMSLLMDNVLTVQMMLRGNYV
jgi:hypothetical protein